MGDLSQIQMLGLGAVGAGAVGSGISAFGSYKAGQSEKAAYDYNAAVTLENMRSAMQTSEARYANLTGKQASRYAASGVDISSGSPLLIMAHTAAQGAQEQESIKQSGTQQSALERYYGKVAAFSGTTGAISTFLGGMSRAGVQAASLLA